MAEKEVTTGGIHGGKKKENKKGRRFNSQSDLNSFIKGICDIMRRSNCAGALQYVPELTWILFLRILDEREAQEAEHAEAVSADFTPSLEAPYRWQDWAAPEGAKRKELQNGTLGAFFGFINGELIPHMKRLREKPNATSRQKVITEMMSGLERTRIDTETQLPRHPGQGPRNQQRERGHNACFYAFAGV